MAITKTNLNTVRNRIFAANSYRTGVATSNTYLGISRIVSWGANAIPQSVETTEEFNEVFRSLIALKKIHAADICLVTPRVDWATGIIYDEYTENLALYSYENLSAITGVVNANAANGVVLHGVGTTFTANLQVGNFITLNGDGNTAPKITKEIISIANNTSLNVNSAYTLTYQSNTAYKVSNTYPTYSHKFYVKNNRDQVFKCLYNNFLAVSTDMPEITIGGSLPEDPYIETSDGYKWKYMYTIPAGLKEKFLTREWMPVTTDTIVYENSINGRLDIIEILNGGAGYINGGNSSNATILTVNGDGADANLTAVVANGVIQSVNFNDRGVNYTNATITVNDPTQIFSSANAEIIAIIGPQNGHGYDPYYGIGAKNLMISVDLNADEEGTIPVTVGSHLFDYSQLVILKDPISSVNSLPLSGLNYKTVLVLNTSTGSENSFNLDDIAFQGITLASSNFHGSVVNWDHNTSELWLNAVEGTCITSAAITGNDINLTVNSVIESEYKPFTGEILYIENRSPITRDTFQTEQIKLVLSF
ncbi:hypothetical protein UFOVP49_10 [uncultured Caudovirales phage]|uniref:Baseplate wedge subunit n=1 Tax=uncultured Caudovirales phage TaxID=2100421 RepID=A0A6J5KS80_9CAUD|nr:hypothetical protein UFOVP49_10 [uncultured Caudovirales phage]